MDKKNWFIYLICIVVIIVLTKQCEGGTRVITKTKTEYIPVNEVITETVIDTVFKKVYVQKVKTIKGKDSIVYKDIPSKNTIEAKKYQTQINSNNASADLIITTTGDLLDVKGSINYVKEKETIETIKIRDASGLYIYGNLPVNSIEPEIGVLYQFKNKMFISTGVQYNQITKSADLKVGLGVKIF